MQLSAPPLIFVVVLIAGAVLFALAIARGGRMRGVGRAAGRACPEPACGAANVRHAKYCARCGRKLD